MLALGEGMPAGHCPRQIFMDSPLNRIHSGSIRVRDGWTSWWRIRVIQLRRRWEVEMRI